MDILHSICDLHWSLIFNSCQLYVQASRVYIVQRQMRKWGDRISKSESIKDQGMGKTMGAQGIMWLLESEHVRATEELEPRKPKKQSPSNLQVRGEFERETRKWLHKRQGACALASPALSLLHQNIPSQKHDRVKQENQPLRIQKNCPWLF